MKKEITILLCNHFDLTWRRCLDSPMDYMGMRWIPYGELHKYYIKRCLAMCEKDDSFRFCIESPAVLRGFLKKVPEDEKKIAALIGSGRLDVPFTGDNIIDSNLVQGESIVRNFLYGSRYMKEHFGQECNSAYRRDAFGNSAQLPQILKQFGIDWVWGLSYTEPDAPVWEGLDGTRICCMEPPMFAESGSIDKYAPCPSCLGVGERDGHICPECEGRGINWRDRKFRLKLPEGTEEPAPYSVWTHRSEELIPPMEMLDWPKEMRKRLCGPDENGEDIKIRFGSFTEIYHNRKKEIERLLQDKDIPVCGPELNANNTGVYVSRIALKKLCRECEDGMSRLEHILVLAGEKGMECPFGQLERLWRQMFFLMFHDAVTGTVVDAAYEELLAKGACIKQEIEALTKTSLGYLIRPEKNRITIFNPGLETAGGIVCVEIGKEQEVCDFVMTAAGEQEGIRLYRSTWKEDNGSRTAQLLVPPIPPMQGLQLRCVPAGQEEGSDTLQQIVPDSEGEYSIENERYLICADSHGITGLLDKRSGRWMKETEDGLRIHDVLIEHDEGSPWTTLSPERSRVSMTERTQLSEIEKTRIYEKMTFRAAPFNANTVEGAEFFWTVTLTRGGSRIDFTMDMEYWDTYNQRVRVAFPSSFKGKHLYEIPYGVLERRPYEGTFDRWDNACGDWPAVRWAGISGSGGSMAVVNYGNPSYLIEEGDDGDRIFLSLLRSPCIPTYLHEPRSYVMKDYDGMRDTGSHRFTYSLALYEGPLEESGIMKEASAFCAGLRALPGALSIGQGRGAGLKSKTAVITAVYPDRDGSLYLRLVEYWGRHTEAELCIPEGRSVTRCRLDGTPYGCEKASEIIEASNPVRIRLKLEPHEITTLRLEKTEEGDG